MMSIRRFLLVAIAVVMAGTSVAVSVATYVEAYHEVDELFDGHLAQQGRILALLAESSAGQLDPAILHASSPGHYYERYVAIQRWSAEGSLLLASASVPEVPLASFAAGLSRTQIAGEDWHVFTQRLSNGDWLMVAEGARAREELVHGAALAVVTPFAIAVPLALVLMALVIGRGLRPLSALQRAVRARDSSNLQPLVTSASNVAELAPLEQAINGLMAQVMAALAREQRFTADAAHELRTLLTVLKLHAHNAANLKKHDDVQASLAQLQAGVDRATHMVTQLLSLARLDPEDADALKQATPLLPVVRQVLADLMPLAERRHQQLDCEGVEAAPTVLLRREALDILLRNLVENALRYSPADTNVSVTARVQGDQVRITVEDEGEGVSAEQAGRVLERFYRGRHDGQGAGLGLSIVSRILTLAGGELAFIPRDSTQKAHVVVTLPRA
ncbi:MAG: sensor histidine kinase N-terminal domain-containing protein [Alcanivoracaceae bacterium]|nr:sensor histidine kinase N-terminal domain-containing protein [Alcanivoracaceae bacterium]